MFAGRASARVCLSKIVCSWDCCDLLKRYILDVHQCVYVSSFVLQVALYLFVFLVARKFRILEFFGLGDLYLNLKTRIHIQNSNGHNLIILLNILIL